MKLCSFRRPLIYQQCVRKLRQQLARGCTSLSTLREEHCGTLAGSNGLLKIVSAAKDEGIQLFLGCGKGADKSCKLFCAWLEYMMYHTTSKADETESIWRSMIELYFGEIEGKL